MKSEQGQLRRCLGVKRSLDREVVSRLREEVRQLIGERVIGSPMVSIFEKRIPSEGPGPAREREQLGHGATTHGHAKALTILNPSEYGTHVVSKVPSGNIGHAISVAVLLHTGIVFSWPG
jgi:hypothetical protein